MTVTFADIEAARRTIGAQVLHTPMLPAPKLSALTGEHPEFGAVTMRQLLATWVVHDLSHISQITRTMTRAYTEAVGPWTAYFRVLQRDVRQ